MPASENNLVEVETPEPKSPRKRKKVILIGLALVIFAGFAALPFTPWVQQLNSNQRSVESGELQQELVEAVIMLKQHDDRLTKIEDRLAKLESAVPTENRNSYSDDISQLQQNVTALSAALKDLQSENKSNSKNALSAAPAIVFIQLREAAISGRGFASELAVMKNLTANDPVAAEQILKLEPYAPKSTPTALALREMLIALESSAALAIDKVSAQTWWQRLQIELKGLVSIRPLHGAGAPDVFTAMETDLAKGDVASSLSDLQNLPSEGQKALNEWRIQAEARQAIDDALQALANHFISSTAQPGKP